MQSPIKVCLFIRVSTDKQDYSRQIKELTEYCEQKSFMITKTIATKITGAKTLSERCDLKELLDTANKNEFQKVVVSEISRIGRNAKDIRNTIDQLHKKNISVVFRNLGGLESLDERSSESFVTNIIIAIYSELAQEERRILSDRIKSGLANAKARGKKMGRPTGSRNTEHILKEYGKVVTDLNKGFSLNQCMRLHNLSKNTVIKVKKILLQIT